MGISRRLAPTVVRDVAETHPRVQSVLKRLSDDLGIDRPRGLALIRGLLIHSIEDLGASYLEDGARRLRRIETLRGHIAEAVDSVVTTGALPEGVDRGGLSRLFDELNQEMEDLRSARRFAETHRPDIDAILAGIGPEGETGRPLPPRQRRGADGTPLPGQHSPVAWPDVMTEMRKDRPARAALIDRALAEQGDAFGMAIMAETQGAQERAIAQVLEGMRPKLEPEQEVELRAGVAEFGVAYFHAREAPGTLGGRLREESLARLPADLRRAVGADHTILGPLADMFPRQADQLTELERLWAMWREGGGEGEFRDYVYREMRSYNRPYQAEFAAAFQTAEQYGLKLLKDPAAFDPSRPNARRINPRDPGTDLLGIRDNGELWYIDDKSHRGAALPGGAFEPVGVSSVSAFERRLPDNMRADADELEAAISRIRGAGGTPDPQLIGAERRVRGCGQRLENLTAGWGDAEWEDAANQALVRGVLDAPEFNIKLKMTSTMGSATGVTERLSGLGIETLPPFKARR